MDTESQLEKLADDSPYTVGELEELFEEKRDEVETKSGDEVPDDSLDRHAMMLVKSDFTREISSGASSDEINIITIGHGGVRTWSDGDVLIAYGVAQPPDEPAHRAGIIFEEGDGHDFEELKGKFTSLQRVSGNFNWNASADLPDTYILNATPTTEVTVRDTDMTLEERREWVNDNHVTEKVEISNIMDHLSANGDEGGFAGTLGADIKRLRGTINDYFISGDGNTGGYILQDDTLVDPRDYDEDKVVGDKRSLGLTGWVDPSMMDYDENSICDFYGSVTLMDNGQVAMNIYGVVPLPGMAIEADITAGDESQSSNSDDVAEETTI